MDTTFTWLIVALWADVANFVIRIPNIFRTHPKKASAIRDVKINTEFIICSIACQVSSRTPFVHKWLSHSTFWAIVRKTMKKRRPQIPSHPVNLLELIYTFDNSFSSTKNWIACINTEIIIMETPIISSWLACSVFWEEVFVNWEITTQPTPSEIQIIPSKWCLWNCLFKKIFT